MKKLSRLLLTLSLVLCVACGSLSAHAEDAPAAQPTAREPRTLTARTGIENTMWKVYAFLAQHGTAYRFDPCAVQTPADAAGAAPAEDAVAVLRLYTYAQSSRYPAAHVAGDNHMRRHWRHQQLFNIALKLGAEEG